MAGCTFCAGADVRTAVPRLPSPHPLGGFLPALLQEDPFAIAFVSGLDEVLSAALWSLDNLEAYIDPGVAPEDFVDWLAGWLAIELDETWSEDRKRALVRQAAEIHRTRGTVAGLRAHLELVTGGTVEIVETGGAAWSQTSGASMPGEPEPRMTIRVSVEDTRSVDARGLQRLVTAAKPAHVSHALEIATR